MLVLSNGIRVMIDHITWYNLRADRERGKWVLQFGYAGGDKTFVAYTDEDAAVAALALADDMIERWLNQ